ncbi:MAG: AraC family transcriptional regulator, partial [Sphingobacteriales bacterium]
MKKEDNSFLKLASLSDIHRAFNLPEPRHPLITLVRGAQPLPHQFTQRHVLGFYKISYKPKLSGKLRYGQSYYDFDGGGL